MPDTKSAHAMILNFPASRTARNKYLLFINYLVDGIFVIVAQTDQNSGLNPDLNKKSWGTSEKASLGGGI